MAVWARGCVQRTGERDGLLQRRELRTSAEVVAVVFAFDAEATGGRVGGDDGDAHLRGCLLGSSLGHDVLVRACQAAEVHDGLQVALRLREGVETQRMCVSDSAL